jgi:hypothetical protein
MRSDIPIRSPPQDDGVPFEGAGGGEEDDPVLLSLFPAAAHIIHSIHSLFSKYEAPINTIQSNTINYLKRVTRRWRKTETTTRASSWPGHRRGPPPKGVNTLPPCCASWPTTRTPSFLLCCHLQGSKARAFS